MDPIRRPPWDGAGGPRECVHGYAEGIPCPAAAELDVSPQRLYVLMRRYGVARRRWTSAHAPPE